MSEPGRAATAEPIHPQPPTPAPPSPKRRSGNELALRLATAAVLVPGVLWLIAAGPGYVLIAVVGIVLLGIREFYHLIEATGAHPLWGFGLAASAAMLAASSNFFWLL